MILGSKMVLSARMKQWKQKHVDVLTGGVQRCCVAGAFPRDDIDAAQGWLAM
jgi:ABC-type taurine transport system substrate-binding protein